MSNLFEFAIAILLCVGLFAISFLIQALFAFKIKNRVVKCLPAVPALLLLILCIVMTVSCIVTVNEAPVEGDAAAQLGQGLGKAFVLIFTILICVPCGGAVLGNIAAWLLYAIVLGIRRKKKAALCPVGEAELPATEQPQPPDTREPSKSEENTP